MEAGELDRDPVYTSLYRPILFGGVDLFMFVFEVCIVSATVFLVGLHPLTIGLAMLWMIVVHPVLRWITRTDHLMPWLYLRHRGHRAFYPPRAHPARRVAMAQRSIPGVD